MCSKKLYIEDRCILTQVYEANTFFSRLSGLFAVERLSVDQGLLLRPCSAVHTVLMRYAIAVIFLSPRNEILKIVREVKPYGFSSCNKAHAVVELLPQALPATVKPGNQVRVCV